MSSHVDYQVKAYTAGAALEPYIRVKKSGATVVAAGAGEAAIGATVARAASGDKVPVRLFNAFGTALLTASGAITANAAVYGTASGKIDDTGTGAIIGYAEEAAAADGDVIEVLIRGSVVPDMVASADQAAVVTTGATNSSPYGFATAGQANAIVTLVNALRAAAVARGDIKGSA